MGRAHPAAAVAHFGGVCVLTRLAWLARTARLLRAVVQGLTRRLIGTVLAAAVALLGAAWLWTDTTGSLAQLLSMVRPLSPGLASLSWSHPDATVRNGGELGTLSWQHDGLAVQASDVRISWQWQANDPLGTPPHGSRLLVTLKAGQVHVTDHSPASDAPLTPPDSLALPWPFTGPLDSWAAPIELVFDIGELTHTGAQALALQHINGRHVYDPAQADWQHTLSLQTQVSAHTTTQTTTTTTDTTPSTHAAAAPQASAHYTLTARAQAQAPMALEATLTGDISGTLPGTATTAPQKPRARSQQTPAVPPATATARAGAASTAPNPAHTWQGQLTATVTGTLATPQATLNAHATLISQAPAGQHAPSAQVQASLLPWGRQPVSSLQANVAELDLAAFWSTLPRTRLSGRAQASPGQAGAWGFDVALANTASGPLDQQRLPVTQLSTTGQVTVGPTAAPTTVTVSRLDARIAGGQVSGSGHWAADAWSGELTATSLQAPALHSTLPATTLQGTLRAAPDTTRPATPHVSLFTVQLSATPARPQRAGQPAGKLGSDSSHTSIKSSIQTILKKREVHFSSEFSWDDQQLDVRKLELNSDGALLSAQGTVQRQPFTLSGQAQLTAPGLQMGAKGQLSPEAGAGSLTADLSQATSLTQWLARLPVWPTTWPTPQLSGAARLAATWQGGWQQGLRVDASVQANQLSGVLPNSGTPGSPGSKVSSVSSVSSVSTGEKWAADNLRWTLSGGLANWQSSLAGQLRWRQWDAHLQTSASGSLNPGGNGPLTAPFESALASPFSNGQARIHTLRLGLAQGTAPGAATSTASASAPASASASAPIPAVALALAPSAVAEAVVQVVMPEATNLQWDAKGLAIDAGALQVQPTSTLQRTGNVPTARLRWDRTTWAAQQLNTRGEVSGVDVQWVRTLSKLFAWSPPDNDPMPGWTGDLTLAGPWQLRWPGTPSAPALLAASLTRQFGDLQAPTGQADLPASSAATTPASTPTAAPARAAATSQQPLGIRTASLTLRGDAQRLTADADWDSQSAGQAHAHVALTHHTPADTALPTADSALSGQLMARLPQAGVWSRLAPPGWRVTGSLALDATLGGTLAQPTWQGQLSARQLSVRSVVEGLEYTQGELDATLSTHRVDITRFSIRGAGGPERGGSLTLTGHATWAPPPATPTVSLQAHADRLNVSARADRRLTVSGDVTTSLANHTLTLRGKLKADQAQFTLPDDTAPTLGPDVVVRLKRANAPPPPAGLRTDVSVDVDLGTAFDVRGQGLQTLLTGQLRVSSPPGATTFSVTGEVRAAQGTYRAYGQLLRIEEGVLRFSGPYDDPTLAILALRGSTHPVRANFGNDMQKVGVRVSGSARNPRLQLYADPELPDSEKLAWLVLGRPASGAGAEAAAMQQAAMALLGSQIRGMEGGLAHSLGLDEVSLAQEAGTSGNNSPGAAVTLGKRLSSRLYVAYEHSLSSAAGALNLFYDVSRRLTVRAQVGGTNALDLIFTLQHD